MCPGRIQRRIGTGFSTAKISMCGKGAAFFEKYLKIIVMGLKPAENGEPENPLPWQGCGKFERRTWQRASCQQTEIAHASAADGHATAFIRVATDTTLPSQRPPSAMEVMKSEGSKTFSYSVFYEMAPEGEYVAFAPALPGCHAQGVTLEETERNVKEAGAVYLESLAAHGDAIPVEAELERRLTSLDQDRRNGVTWATLKAKLEQRC
jgi:predicted RNase H-like HicB family nuclease